MSNIISHSNIQYLGQFMCIVFNNIDIRRLDYAEFVLQEEFEYEKQLDINTEALWNKSEVDLILFDYILIKLKVKGKIYTISQEIYDILLKCKAEHVVVLLKASEELMESLLIQHPENQVEVLTKTLSLVYEGMNSVTKHIDGKIEKINKGMRNINNDEYVAFLKKEHALHLESQKNEDKVNSFYEWYKKQDASKLLNQYIAKSKSDDQPNKQNILS